MYWYDLLPNRQLVTSFIYIYSLYVDINAYFSFIFVLQFEIELSQETDLTV